MINTDLKSALSTCTSNYHKYSNCKNTFLSNKVLTAFLAVLDSGFQVEFLSEISLYRPLGYERVYLTLCKVADTPFHIQGDDMCNQQD